MKEETKLQIELMGYAKTILSYGVPYDLLSKFERVGIKRYEELKKELGK